MVVLILFFAITVLVIYYSNEEDKTLTSSNPEMVKDENGNPRKRGLTFDFAKPIFVKAGFPLCPDQNELDAFRSHAPNECIVMPVDNLVIIEDSSGFIDRIHKIRLMSIKTAVEGWTVSAALRN